jgi:hypothetical protein
MTNDAGIHTFVLHELRLRDTADADAVARIVAAIGSPGSLVPLLTSIDDDRDVAILRAFAHDSDSDIAPSLGLDDLVATSQPPQRYVPRISERTEGVPTHYRLAVTASGINNSDPMVAMPDGGAARGPRTSLDLLWIGVPLGTYAGSMVLVGKVSPQGEEAREASAWSSALSRSLGVRIYDSRR